MEEGRRGMRVPAHQNYGSMNQTLSQVIMDQTVKPSAPLLYNIDGAPGYEGTTAEDGEGRYFPPPPDVGPPPAWNSPNSAGTPLLLGAISEDTAKEAFVEYAASKCCYSKTPAKEMVFKDLVSFNTYRYRLETFTESRSTAWKTEPYTGGLIDSHMSGIAPSPWDVRVEVPDMFKDAIKKIRVPHTSSLKGCPECGCGGRRPCDTCHGSTREQCSKCSGRGVQNGNETCSQCSGMTTTICKGCLGTGTTACHNCKGKGQVLTYVELHIEWKNNVFEYLADQKCGFPAELFNSIGGQKLFVDEQHLVHPVEFFPDYTINQASRSAVEQHQVQFASTSKILRQRQTVELLLLTRVEYEWHNKSYSYYVYGNEHKVYAEKYPRKCCTIM